MSAARRVVFSKAGLPSFVLAATPDGAALLVRWEESKGRAS
jgi:hypothetical protein